MNPEYISMIGMVTATAAACLLYGVEEELSKRSKRSNKKKRPKKIRKKIITPAPKSLKKICLKNSRVIIREDTFCKLFKCIYDNQDRLLNGHSENVILLENKLALTLRYLATGESIRHLSGISSYPIKYVCKSILEVCEAIYKNMAEEQLKLPKSKKEWKQIAKEFNEEWKFPLCVGALAGKCPSLKFTKQYKSTSGTVVILGLADAKSRFTFIDVNISVPLSNEVVLKSSKLSTMLEGASTYMPEATIIGDNRYLPYVIVADETFPLQRNLLIPYADKSSKYYEKIFDISINRARKSVDNAFDMLCNRFKVLQSVLNFPPENVRVIIQACCLLHNFLINQNDWHPIEESDKKAKCNLFKIKDSSLENNETTGDEIAKIIREEFAYYFSFEGSIVVSNTQNVSF